MGTMTEFLKVNHQIELIMERLAKLELEMQRLSELSALLPELNAVAARARMNDAKAPKRPKAD